jgi:hypothetical protein
MWGQWRRAPGTHACLPDDASRLRSSLFTQTPRLHFQLLTFITSTRSNTGVDVFHCHSLNFAAEMSKEQLFQLLPLPDDGLQQVLDYAATLSKAEAAEHFLNMLGDSPQVVDFISTFNARRADPKPAKTTTTSSTSYASASAPASAPPTAPSSAQNSDMDGVPKPRRGPKKKKANLHTPPPRPVAAFEPTQGATVYKKEQLEDYMPAKSSSATPSNSWYLISVSRNPNQSRTQSRALALQVLPRHAMLRRQPRCPSLAERLCTGLPRPSVI